MAMLRSRDSKSIGPSQVSSHACFCRGYIPPWESGGEIEYGSVPRVGRDDGRGIFFVMCFLDIFDERAYIGFFG